MKAITVRTWVQVDEFYFIYLTVWALTMPTLGYILASLRNVPCTEISFIDLSSDSLLLLLIVKHNSYL